MGEVEDPKSCLEVMVAVLRSQTSAVARVTDIFALPSYTEMADKVIDSAYISVSCEMWPEFGMREGDLELFYQESPNLMKRIDEIENELSPLMADDEIRNLMGAWVKNWGLVFKRRKMLRDQEDEETEVKALQV